LQVEPREALMVGIGERDVVGAAKVGMKTSSRVTATRSDCGIKRRLRVDDISELIEVVREENKVVI